MGPVELGCVPFTVAPIFPAVNKEHVVIKDIGKLLTNPV